MIRCKIRWEESRRSAFLQIWEEITGKMKDSSQFWEKSGEREEAWTVSWHWCRGGGGVLTVAWWVWWDVRVGRTEVRVREAKKWVYQASPLRRPSLRSEQGPHPTFFSSINPSCTPLPPSPSPRFLLGQGSMALANRAAHRATRHSPIIHCIPQRDGGKGRRRAEGRWLNWWVFPHC